MPGSTIPAAMPWACGFSLSWDSSEWAWPLFFASERLAPTVMGWRRSQPQRAPADGSENVPIFEDFDSKFGISWKQAKGDASTLSRQRLSNAREAELGIQRTVERL